MTAGRLDPKKMKSLWQEKKGSRFTFFCPLCHSSRAAPHRPTPSARHYVQIALTSASLAALTWPWFSWKGIVSFLPLWIGFETIYRLRARASLACPNCGFDPYLYLVDVKQARAEIENHYRKKFAEKGIPFPGDESPAARPGGSSPVPGESPEAAPPPPTV